MCWSEFDLEQGIGRCQRAGAKTNVHIRCRCCRRCWPLSKRCRAWRRDQLFGQRGNGFTAWSRGKAALDRRSGVKNWTTHDLRRSVATRMADIGIAPHIIEQILNHQSGHKAGPPAFTIVRLRARGAQRVGAVGGPRPQHCRGQQAQDCLHAARGVLMPSVASGNKHSDCPLIGTADHGDAMNPVRTYALAFEWRMKRRGHAVRVEERRTPGREPFEWLVASFAPFPLRYKVAPGHTGDNRPRTRKWVAEIETTRG